jgi:hypothetical protein
LSIRSLRGDAEGVEASAIQEKDRMNVHRNAGLTPARSSVDRRGLRAGRRPRPLPDGSQMDGSLSPRRTGGPAGSLFQAAPAIPTHASGSRREDRAERLPRGGARRWDPFPYGHREPSSIASCLLDGDLEPKDRQLTALAIVRDVAQPKSLSPVGVTSSKTPPARSKKFEFAIANLR